MEDKKEGVQSPETEAESAALPEEEAPLAVNDDDPNVAVARLEAELEEARGRHLRALADLENARRRHERDLDEARKFAATGFARDMLEVADNLRRALESVPEEARGQSELVKNLLTGVEMTERTLLGAFDKHKITRIDPQKGDKFDHNLHQAMFEVPTPGGPAGLVAEVMQPGYQIAGRLLRPALVGVSKAAPAPAEPAN